ncbi:related to transcription initiation factor [Claviceps purpurea 20.1]|uniref:Related to transcription initiation factor n=1 Tax=Claviceps purpurea (strain 20.1) TaxID=1111077 RepID=M1WFH2_CLAP2|nr:related to transcription initiation factor [Claviceps purpurea 20.1]
MVLERIYVVRHGGDPSLTSYGIDQSKELGAHLMTLDPGVDKVYSSPFYRCLQTMSPFMELQHQRAQTGSTVTSMLPEHGIREWFGSAPFDHPEPAAPTILKSMFPSYDQGYVPVVTPSKRGETLEQLQDRIAMALRGIVEQCDADGSRAVVLCTHAAVIIMIGRILTGQFPVKVDSDDFKAYTCGLSVYARSEPVVASLARAETEDSFASRNSRRRLSHSEQGM